MIMCCSWCFAPMVINDDVAVKLLAEQPFFPVCSPECGEALDAADEQEDAGEDEQ